MSKKSRHSIAFLFAALALMWVAVSDGWAHEPGDHLPKLSAEEAAGLEGLLYGMNNLSAVHFPQYLPPYVCSFTFFIHEEWYPVIEWELRHRLAHTTPKERKDYPFLLFAWWVALDQVGCGNWNPPFGDWKPHD